MLLREPGYSRTDPEQSPSLIPALSRLLERASASNQLPSGTPIV